MASALNDDIFINVLFMGMLSQLLIFLSENRLTPTHWKKRPLKKIIFFALGSIQKFRAGIFGMGITY
ncbi:hypothetical protein J4453_01285 [Candidatus Woesearchaeota archaeon]|nr:hypothetical protein [Candidatus Woesearchaeota archaeon]